MANRTHILFLPRWYPNPNDPQLGVFIQKHAVAASRNSNVTVFYPYGVKTQNKTYEIVTNVTEHLTEVCVWYKQTNNKVLNTFRYFRSYLKAANHIQFSWKSIDLTHVNIMAKPAVVAFLLKRCFNTPYIITEQWSGYTKRSEAFSSKSGIIKRIWRFLGNQSNLVITVSKFLEKAMQEQNVGKQFVQLPNIIESVDIQNNEKRESTIRILNVSDLVDSTKNITGLLNAFKAALKSMPNLHLDIVGGGKDEEMLKKHCNSLKLENHVTFHGRVNNQKVYEFMHQTNLVIVNSYFETFSVVCAEGLICGKPVIATDCGGPSEFINEQVGKLVPIADNEALSEAIVSVSQNIDSFPSEKLHNYALQKFSYEAVGNLLHKYYQQVLN